MSINSTKIDSSLVLRPQASEPSAPQDGEIYYDSTLQVFRKYENGFWSNLSSSGGGKNYIGNGTAEAGTTGWALYGNTAANIPFNGTGGIVTGMQLTTTQVDPLAGDSSFSLEKDTSNTQGKGASYDFTIDREDQAKLLTIQFSYTTDVNFIAGDGSTPPLQDGTTSVNLGNSSFQVFMYDVDNSSLIQLSSTALTSKGSEAAKYTASFQTSPTALNYRLIVHCTDAGSLAASMVFDSVSVAPMQGITASTKIAAGYTGQGQSLPIGESIIIYTNKLVDTYGAYNTSTGIYTVPVSGTYTVSAALSVATVLVNSQFYLRKNGTVVISTRPGYADNTAYNILTGGTFEAVAGDELYFGYFNSTGGLQNATDYDNYFSISCVAPVSVDVTPGYVFSGSNSTGPTVANGAQETMSFPATDPGSVDNLGWYNTGNGILTAKRNCRLLVNVNLLWNANATGVRQLFLTKNSAVIYVTFTQAASAVETQQSLTRLVDMKAGDILEIQILQNSGGTLGLFASGFYNQLNIAEVPQINIGQASDTVAAIYYATSNGIPIGPSNPGIFAGKIEDTHNAMNTTTGQYTVPVSGLYNIQAFMNYTTGATGPLSIWKNDIQNIPIGHAFPSVYGLGCGLVRCTAGDLIDVRTTNTVGINGTAGQPYTDSSTINIIKVGN